MNIKIAAEKTGLTKKAIKYYESEGLISPVKNDENNYRNYTEQDIIKLNLIGALRVIDISVSEIKNVTDGKKSIPEVMQEALERINKDINSLEKSKLIITNIIEKNLNDYSSAGEQIKKLRETLEFSLEEKREFVSKTLLRIFPGKFGERFVFNNEPFLNITIDTEKKKNAWLKLVKLLDDFDEVSETNGYVSLTNTYNKFYTEEITNEHKKKLETGIYNMNNFLDSNFEEVTEKSMNSLLKINEVDKEALKKLFLIVEETNNTLGKFQRQFNECLSILNEDYKKYMDNFIKLAIEMKNEFMKETGMDIDTWISKNILENKQK